MTNNAKFFSQHLSIPNNVLFFWLREILFYASLIWPLLSTGACWIHIEIRECIIFCGGQIRVAIPESPCIIFIHLHSSNCKNLSHFLHPPSTYGTSSSFFCNPAELIGFLISLSTGFQQVSKLFETKSYWRMDIEWSNPIWIVSHSWLYSIKIGWSRSHVLKS